MRIVADRNIPFVKELFRDFGEVVTVPGREIGPSHLDKAAMLLVRSVTPVDEKLLGESGVKFVASATIGTDHIDEEYLRRAHVGFAYAPGSNADSVAEYVISAIMHLVSESSGDVAGRTIGIVGVGNVGSSVLRRARTLGMRCLLNDPPKKRLTGNGSYLSLADVLEQADIVTLHVPLTTTGEDATYHLIGEGRLAAMKPGAMLINTSRGKVIDETAMREGRAGLGHIVLDVWEHEPDIDPGLLDIVDIATPHIAGYSFDGKLRGAQMIYEAACSFFFREKKRTIAQFAPREFSRVQRIRLKNTVDVIPRAIMAAYPIRDDDGRLRTIGSIPADERGSFFDNLRHTYPVRYEFPHYSIECSSPIGGNERRALQDLGFSGIHEKSINRII